MGDHEQDDLHAGFRQALDDLVADYAARAAQAGFDADAYFQTLRRLVEAGAMTEALVAADGPMGGGGADEA